MDPKERNVLGRGLSALIPEGHAEKEKIQEIDILKIKASDFQPRQYFSQKRLEELAESIQEKGVIQPILLRAKADEFEIIAGERRYRAAQKLGLKTIPAIIKEVNDEDLLELSLIENIQREELNRIEEAKAYKRLATEFNMTHESISKKVSKDRATVTNLLRLLELPTKIQNLLEENTITLGHAKTLLSVPDSKEQGKICDKIVKKGLSVRQTENITRQHVLGKSRSAKRQKNVYLASIEDKLQHFFGTRVKIFQGKKRGKLVIEYFSQEDLNRILGLIENKQ